MAKKSLAEVNARYAPENLPDLERQRSKIGNVTDETKRNRNRKTEPGVAKPAGRMEADDLFADDTSDIDVPVYRKDKSEGAGGVEQGAEAGTSKPRRDIYDVLGRARPQRISPHRPEPAKPEPVQPESTQVQSAKTESEDAGLQAAEIPVESGSKKNQPSSGVSEQPTTVMPVAGKGDDSPRGGSAVKSDKAAKTPDQETRGLGVRGSQKPKSEPKKAGAEGSRAGVAGSVAGAAGAGAASAGVASATASGSNSDAGAAGEAPVAEDENHLVPVGEGGSSDAGADPALAEPEDTEDETEAVVRDKRGTTGFGLLLLRVVAGALLLIYGLQTLFAFGGNPGLNTFEGVLNQYKFADLLAVGLSIGQVVAGGLLILGLLTPVGAAVGAIVSAFLSGHYMGASGGNLWPYALSPQTQLWGLLALICMTLIFVGPGRISVDRNRGWARRPLASAWIFAIIAVGGASALWLVVGGGNPIH